jgi:hypothetical protein
MRHQVGAEMRASVVYAETGALGAHRFGVLGLSYLRPVRVEIDDFGGSIRIRDHVMVARLAIVLLLVAAALWRLLDDR